ncbi:MAG: hypothetical protein OEZ59_06255 [Deltaproteobacteria bacterium]|nr:hypothetical protein [Deltaproteobacteria bacterium]
MLTSPILIGIQMQIRSLVRNRLSLLLLLLIPVVFFGVIDLTSADRDLRFKIASISGETYITVAERSHNIAFMAVALCGFLVSFYALSLVQKNRASYQRLLLCGYRSLDLVLSLVATQAIVTILIALYVTLLTRVFFPPEYFWGTFWGLSLTGFVYGAYGSFVGSLIEGHLEGILMIVLLANIDAGWLQNPVFYAGAENQVIVRYLPAFYPSQVTMIQAFSAHSAVQQSLFSLGYGMIFIGLALLLFRLKLRPLSMGN